MSVSPVLCLHGRMKSLAVVSRKGAVNNGAIQGVASKRGSRQSPQPSECAREACCLKLSVVGGYLLGKGSRGLVETANRYRIKRSWHQVHSCPAADWRLGAQSRMVIAASGNVCLHCPFVCFSSLFENELCFSNRQRLERGSPR